MTGELTSRQQTVLEAIERFWNEQGVSPSLADLATTLDVSRATVHEHLVVLKKKGYLENIEGAGRSWRPLTRPRQSQSVRVPLLGRVAAGAPILAKENIEDWITVDGVNDADQLFALRVRGDSMVEAGILDGDVVIVRKQDVAENGTIVVALVDGEEATVKKLRRDGDDVLLIAMNPLYEPIRRRGDHVRVLGKVVGLRRCLAT